MWAPEFEPFGNSDTWPEIWRPKLVSDPTRYAIKKGWRQHLRIHNEMVEEYTHQTYTFGRYKQPGHNRRTCTAPPNNEGNTILFFIKLTIATSITHLWFQILLTRVISAGLVLKKIKLDLLEITCVMLFFLYRPIKICVYFFMKLDVRLNVLFYGVWCRIKYTIL
jgi:hypothetical protein